MDIWSKYSQQGIWGLWREFFADDIPWSLQLSFGEHAFLIDGQNRRPLYDVAISGHESFFWRTASGLSLTIWSEVSPSSTTFDQWSLLLHYESVKMDLRPTFLPFFPSRTEFALGLNNLLSQPGQVVLFSGQPGVGKRTLLQGLSLLHAGRVSNLEPQAVSHWVTPHGEIWIVPEVAMLETDVQQRILKSVSQGARLWAATAYDLGVLRSRQIVLPSVAELLAGGRFHLPPVSSRDKSDLRMLEDFWSSLHGVVSFRPQTNLEFLKQRTLLGAQLSVGSILEEGSGLRGVIAEFEKEAIRQAYARVGRSQHKIARLLKVSRGSLQHKLRKYQLESYASADADTEEEG